MRLRTARLKAESLMSIVSTAAEAMAPRYVAAQAARAPFVAFGDAVDAALITVPAPQLGAEPLVELWPAREDVLFGAVAMPESMPLESAARSAYDRVIADARAAGFPYLLRVWNHMSRINEDEAGEERYKRFCEGRYAAFEAAGYELSSDLPAASAVGMSGEGLAVYYLAAKQPGIQVENPRQVEAYRYPPRYGPKSPSFSRATVFGEVVFVSGTASVVGHETVHPGDIDAQLAETLRNLDTVMVRAGARGVSDLTAVKTYVRNPSDYTRISAGLDAALPASCSRIFLQSDICRADLLLEIEGVGRRG
jgi:chorismate lyase/3-hydroxybenzoate synthase